MKGTIVSGVIQVIIVFFLFFYSHQIFGVLLFRTHQYWSLLQWEREDNNNGGRERRFSEAEENSSGFLWLWERSKMGRLLVQHPHPTSHGFPPWRHWPLQAQILPALHRPYLLLSQFPFSILIFPNSFSNLFFSRYNLICWNMDLNPWIFVRNWVIWVLLCAFAAVLLIISCLVPFSLDGNYIWICGILLGFERLNVLVSYGVDRFCFLVFSFSWLSKHRFCFALIIEQVILVWVMWLI